MSLKFNHHVFRRIPLIIYSSHIFFQQTNTTGGFLPEGVGGFTEYIKGRVVLPFNGSFEDFRHVLHHEMVHVFQISKANESYRNHPRISKAHMPLWWTEGLAEYFSTEWNNQADLYMRDLVLDNQIPSLKILEHAGGGIIYKFGQSVHMLLGKMYGDEMIVRMYENLWQFKDFDSLFQYVYGISVKDFSNIWLHELRKKYYPDIQVMDELKVIRKNKVATKGYLNIHPTAFNPPNGEKERVVFVSPRTGYLNIYSVELAKGEKDLKKHVEGGRQAEFESFHPFQARFDVNEKGILAFASKYQQSDALFLWDLETSKEVDYFRFKGLVGISSPSWAPDGEKIVFNGLNLAGFSDLYQFDIKTRDLKRLTNDRYLDDYPDFSPDGRYIAFESDRTIHGKEGYKNIFLYDTQTEEIKYLTEGKWIDSQPRFAANSNTVAFVSDRSGVPNIYTVDLDGSGRQETNLYNGMFGFDWACGDSSFVFSALSDFTAGIYEIKRPDSTLREITLKKDESGYQWSWDNYRDVVESRNAEKRDYERHFRLDFAYGDVGYDTSPYYGGTYGQALFMFSDLLSDELVLLAMGNSATSTEDFWESFSGYATYYNRKHRLHYGFGAFRFAGRFVDFRRDELYYQRDHGVYGIISYPLSKYMRVETSMGLIDSYRDDYFLDRVRDSYLASNSISFIKDTSLFLPYGPIDGERIQVGMALTTDLSKGRTDNVSLLLDWRKYFRLTTYSAYAVRIEGRYSGGNIPYRYIMGGSWSLRGYERWSLIGSRMVLLNQELRFPIFHRMDFRMSFGTLPLPGLQGAIFCDLGNAWDKGESYPGLLGSAGFGLRMSLGGPLVLRLDRARRFDLLRDGVAADTDFDKKYYTNFFFGYDY